MLLARHELFHEVSGLTSPKTGEARAAVDPPRLPYDRSRTDPRRCRPVTTDDAALALTVWKFSTAAGAAGCARLLATPAVSGLRVDAAEVSWPRGTRTPRVENLRTAATSGSVNDSFWGLFFGLVFFMPLIGAAVSGTTGSLAGTLSDVGIDDSFINKIRDRITPGSFALFTLTAEDDVKQIRAVLAPTQPSEVLFTNLTADQARALRSVFGQP
jgi:uncharacterized membrane protein